MATVYHYTRPEHIESIWSDYEIKREMCNLGKPKDPYNKLLTKAQGGQLVWFTEEDRAFNSCRPGTTQYGFEFNTDTTPGIYRWQLIRDSLYGKKQFRQVVEMMDITARAFGDNPDRWWFSRKPVSLTHCDNVGNLKEATFDPAPSIEEMFERSQALLLESRWNKEHHRTQPDQFYLNTMARLGFQHKMNEEA